MPLPGLKRTYTVPRLQTYGNIRDLTGNLGGVGKMDGGSMPTDKTST